VKVQRAGRRQICLLRFLLVGLNLIAGPSDRLACWSGSAQSLVQCSWNLSFRADVELRNYHQEEIMGRGLLLWLIGIPIPIILLIWAFGGLH
jgi:hypothetical protein